LAAATSGRDEKKGGLGARVLHVWAAAAVGQASQTPAAIPAISMGKRRHGREKTWGQADKNGRPELSRASRTDAKSAQICVRFGSPRTIIAVRFAFASARWDAFLPKRTKVVSVFGFGSPRWRCP
jgi:hypothetical protein